MVFQQFNLVKRSSVITNVLAGRLGYAPPGASLFHRFPAIDRELALKALDRVGMHDKARKQARELSGGQQQRVGIARALVTEPALILADEPTGNLDSHAGAEVLDLFKDLHALGRTIVLITHDVDVAAAADRAVHLRDGLLLEAVHA
jgi:ABC-type phosphate/phosphonate transport system ATPase subunit